MKKTLSVIIPSREQPNQIAFLERAIKSIQNQTLIERFEMTLLVGVDANKIPQMDVPEKINLKFIESYGQSQAAALNCAIRAVNTDFVAILEDDDEWMPHFLGTAMKAISLAPFVSSTQLEYDENNHILRINDFPTPSGWFMTTGTLKEVGEFNDNYRFHLDNEWLGRLCELKIPRRHMVELTAPADLAHMKQVRPWLASVILNSGGFAKIARHQYPIPLVRRLVHSGSGMAKIASTPSLKTISNNEYKRLIGRFGRVPW